MMKKYVPFLVFIIAVLITHLGAQPTLDIRITDPNPEVIYVADLDIMQLASGNEFFEIALSNFDDQAYVDCKLTLSFYKDQQLLARIESDEFTIPALMGRRSANNVELMQDEFYLSQDQSQSIDVHESNIFTNEIDNLERDILSSGKLPMGHYELVGVLIGTFGTSETSDFFDITNPSFVELIAPGAEAGSGFKEEVYTEFPIFQWNGNGSEYQVVVFEKKFSLQSLDNVLNMTPNWKSEILENYSVQYPPGGTGEGGSMVIPLEFGKTYYWMVKMLVQTSAGIETINSEIWEFQLVDPVNLGDQQGAITRNMLIEFLRDLIGDKADELAKQLGDYNVKSINVNGQDMSIEDLYLLINEYRLKDVEVVDLILPTGSY